MSDSHGKEIAPGNTPSGQDYAAQGEQTAQKRGYEPADLNVRRILIAMGILIGIIAAAQFGLKGFERFLRAGGTDGSANLVPLAFGPQIPPAPRLQADPKQEWDTLKAEQTTLLHSYGWADADHKTVHIPIEQAEAQLLQTGLPRVGARPWPTPKGGTGYAR